MFDNIKAFLDPTLVLVSPVKGKSLVVITSPLLNIFLVFVSLENAGGKESTLSYLNQTAGRLGQKILPH